MPGSLGQRLITKVVNRLGGIERAANELGIRPTLLMRFVEGTLEVPDAVLLKAVDYCIDELPAPPAVAVLPETQKPKKPLA